MFTKEMKKQLKKDAKEEKKKKEAERLAEEEQRRKEDEEKRRQEEEKRLAEEEQKRKEEEAKQAKKEEAERKEMALKRRQVLGDFRKSPDTTTVNDEDAFKMRHGYVIVRKPCGHQHNAVLFPVTVEPPKHNITEVVVKVVMFDKCSVDFKKNMVEQGLKITKFLGDAAVPLRHPSLVKVLDTFSSAQKAYVFMEKSPTDTIEHKILRGTGLIIEEVIKTSRQIGEALLFLHHNGFAHLGVRCDNLVLDSQSQVRLVNLDRVCVCWNADAEQPVRHPQIQEPSFRTHFPPEVFASGDFEATAVDVFCFGAAIFHMMVRERPFRKVHQFKGKENMRTIWQKQMEVKKEAMKVLPEELLTILVPMVASSTAAERPALQEVMKNAFFKDTYAKTFETSPAKEFFPNNIEKSKSNKSAKSKK